MQKRDWVLRDLWNDRVKNTLWKKLSGFTSRFIRLFVLIGVLVYFFTFGIAPTASMYPTIQVNDMMLFVKTDEFKRGDIIYFKFPEDETQMYLKRVIGIGGDTIEVKGGFVYVNGIKQNESYIHEKPEYTMESRVVPENQYFVLGDNRNDSFDSFHWGNVKKEQSKGKMIAVILPFNRIHLFFIKPDFYMNIGKNNII